MRDSTTWIKLDRNILEWRWYKDPNTFKLFVHLLLRANYEPHDFKQETIGRGELATSTASLAAETGLTLKAIRIALAHLEKTGEIEKRAIRGNGGYTVISIVSYDRYQDGANKGQIKGKQRANKGQRYKNIRNKEEENGRAEHAAPPESPYMRVLRMGLEGDDEEGEEVSAK